MDPRTRRMPAMAEFRVCFTSDVAGLPLLLTSAEPWGRDRGPSPSGAASNCAGGHAAPMGLGRVMSMYRNYKHVAPLELGAGVLSWVARFRCSGQPTRTSSCIPWMTNTLRSRLTSAPAGVGGCLNSHTNFSLPPKRAKWLEPCNVQNKTFECL